MNFDERRQRYLRVFEERGHPSGSYLQDHARRFLRTFDLVLPDPVAAPGLTLLDIASNWLHSAYLYAEAGVKVTALDLQGGEISSQAVIEFAREHGIALLPCTSLNNPVELDSVPDDSFDVVMFAETIEHITFNPIRMWSLVYKKLKPGGRIIVTTPNYFFLRGALWQDMCKIFRGFSTGIAVDDVIHAHDYAPHWKEFSRKDLQAYFAYLSPDFQVSRVVYADMYGGHPRGRWRARLGRKFLPALFYNTLYVEVTLAAKRAGIVATARW